MLYVIGYVTNMARGTSRIFNPVNDTHQAPPKPRLNTCKFNNRHTVPVPAVFEKVLRIHRRIHSNASHPRRRVLLPPSSAPTHEHEHRQSNEARLESPQPTDHRTPASAQSTSTKMHSAPRQDWPTECYDGVQFSMESAPESRSVRQDGQGARPQEPRRVQVT